MGNRQATRRDAALLAGALECAAIATAGEQDEAAPRFTGTLVRGILARGAVIEVEQHQIRRDPRDRIQYGLARKRHRRPVSGHFHQALDQSSGEGVVGHYQDRPFTVLDELAASVARQLLFPGHGCLASGDQEGVL